MEMNPENETPPANSAPPADPVWSEIAAKDDTIDTTLIERVRCVGVVNAEISRGAQAGVPTTSSVMVILERIAAAIRNG